MVRIPPFAPVVDLTGTLAPNDISGLTSDIEALRLRKGVQVAILMLPGVKPETIEQFALRTFESWKPGRKGEDNGVLIVVAKDQRRMRIEVGYGLEGVITDLLLDGFAFCVYDQSRCLAVYPVARVCVGFYSALIQVFVQ